MGINEIETVQMIKKIATGKTNNIYIQLLRYFYEERPDIYVIAAGSLLEYALRKIPNFSVGRIDYLYLHPLNFVEFLNATQNEGALEIINKRPMKQVHCLAAQAVLER